MKGKINDGELGACRNKWRVNLAVEENPRVARSRPVIENEDEASFGTGDAQL